MAILDWWKRRSSGVPPGLDPKELAAAIRRARPGYASDFGGYWTDQPDALERVAGLRAAGSIDAGEEGLLQSWIRDGFVILPGAVSGDRVDGINREIDAIWERADASYLIEIADRRGWLQPGQRAGRYKLLDLYVRCAAAREAATCAGVGRFLQLIYGRDYLLFQSLSFETGSEQALHQDAAYVVLDSPMELAASWIALEDVEPGSGELHYYVGSHRLPEWVFPGGARSYDTSIHADAMHSEYLGSLRRRSEGMGLELRTFCPRKGDVLIWSADLVHGGAPVQDRALTRRSLVSHYCPADVRPYFMYQHPIPPPIRPIPGGGNYCSSHYPL